ncbi:MAG: hypothetical protein Q9220_005961 [cf. Caloplaca sp. 1 TL-2023]
MKGEQSYFFAPLLLLSPSMYFSTERGRERRYDAFDDEKHAVSRKVECDLNRSGCGQCVRSLRVCSGYRDVAQLRIQDETSCVKEKAVSQQTTLSISASPSLEINYQARNVFFLHYVSGFSKAFDVLGLLYTHSSHDPYLHTCVETASLAYFSFQNESSEAQALARLQYTRALQQLNAALRIPSVALRDSTLLAVLLLDLSEKILDHDPGSLDSWMGHINGALALMKLRGHDSLHEYISRRLSARLGLVILTSCVTAGVPVPSALMRLRQDLEPYIDPSDPKWQLMGLVAEYTQLQPFHRKEHLPVSAFSSKVFNLDARLHKLALEMPSAWQPKTTDYPAACDETLESHFDVYPDHFAAQTWNVLRVMRILLNVSPSSQENKITKASAVAVPDFNQTTVDGLAKDICASVPRLLRHQAAEHGRFSGPTRCRIYTLIFPLYVAAMYAAPSTLIKPWVMTQLLYMSEVGGIRQARDVARVLAKDDGTSPWLIYASLGSYAFAA